ncbi:Zinc finger CW-type PWWP domain protein 1 [Frankliniella fusca]|uniref:Zinc finger CW-type PWWP domain protein 1 n=1 Tax=Frankliniella fusca TaxID=407009 RepID=A0AAE1L7R5_9NEOP|nr:Zinc finger CW-type PWWP domain protein 1 [Frankliniella fusca]
MAPNKFVAPLKKNGDSSSLSFSSNSSLGSQANQETSKTMPRPAPEIKTSQGFSVPIRNLSKAHNSSRTSPLSKRNLESTSDDNPTEPLAKRFHLEKISETATIKVEVEAEDNNDKENVKPEKSSKKPKAPKDTAKRPPKSLTDQEYENIFKAVLARFPPAELSDPPENTVNSPLAPESSKESKKKAAEESEDMFEFSQSDFDSEIASKALDNTIPVPNSTNATTAIILPVSNTGNNCSQDQIVPPSPSITFMCHMSQPIQLEDNTEGLALSCEENTGSRSQAEPRSSQETLNIKTEVASVSSSSQITSTPLTTPQKLDAPIKISLSQEVNFSPIIHETTSSVCNPASQLLRPPSLNQNQNISVLKPPTEISNLNCSTSESTSVPHERIDTLMCTPVRAPATLCASEDIQHLKTPVKTSDGVHTPQSSQGPKTPLRTPTIIRTPQSSQGPNTSLRTPTITSTPQLRQGSLTRTPVRTPTTESTLQSSQSQKTPTLVRKPVIDPAPQSSQGPGTPPTVRKPTNERTPQSSQDPKTPNAKDANRSVPSTPNSSQQFSEEVQFTPPPSKSTARDRLRWIHKKRLVGLWVQCDVETCGKWRYLPDCHDPSTLPEKWFCSMHPDKEYNHCSAPEKRESLRVEEDMIFNKYCPGSLVWARVPGYPWWPAMVDDDPDLEIFYWLNLFSDIPNWYHVVFFDDDRRSSCVRAWIPVERLMKLEDLDEESIQNDGYQERVTEAYKKACTAKNLTMDDRLAQHSFAACYKGPIGGPSKTLYEGPIGYRKAVK